MQHEEQILFTDHMVNLAVKRIKELCPPEGCHLAFSGGKDSCTVERLARMAGVKFTLHFGLTTIDPPEVLKFVREHYPETVFHRPERSMWRLIIDKGIARAGAKEVVGIDINIQPEYPFAHIWMDFRDLPGEYLKAFDFIWASPPCQAYTWATERLRNSVTYPDYISGLRRMLIASGKPYCIENVPQAPTRHDVILDGTMFSLGVIRRRAFECSGFWVLSLDGIKRGSVRTGEYCTVAGHAGNGKGSLKAWQDAMGIDWISDKKMLAQAVPPAYSEYIMRAFMQH